MNLSARAKALVVFVLIGDVGEVPHPRQPVADPAESRAAFLVSRPRVAEMATEVRIGEVFAETGGSVVVEDVFTEGWRLGCLVHATRESEDLHVGVSTRGALTLYRAAQSLALVSLHHDVPVRHHQDEREDVDVEEVRVVRDREEALRGGDGGRHGGKRAVGRDGT